MTRGPRIYTLPRYVSRYKSALSTALSLSDQNIALKSRSNNLKTTGIFENWKEQSYMQIQQLIWHPDQI